MKIQNVLYPIIIGGLLVLLLIQKCGRDNITTVDTDYSITIDSLTNLINEYANKQDSVRIDTVVKEKVVYLTKTITKPVYVDSSVTPPIQEYTYANGKGSVVVLDTLQVKGEILSHSQAIYITDTCENKTIIKEVPVVNTVKVTETITQEYSSTRLLAGVQAGTNNMNNIAPTLTLQTKYFNVGVSKPLLTDEFRFNVQIPITKRKIKKNKGLFGFLKKNK